jgi:hypothetical protein
MRAYVQF